MDSPEHSPGNGRSAFSDLALLVYEDLRNLAHRYMKNEPLGHTLQPTALVHEAYLRLGNHHGRWNGRTHFFATASREMRRVLVDHARRVRADKRGGGQLRVALSEEVAVTPSSSVDVIALDEALARLEQVHPRQAQVADLRLFAGMTHDEVAGVIGIGVRTAKEDWRVARAWLAMALDQAEPI